MPGHSYTHGINMKAGNGCLQTGHFKSALGLFALALAYASKPTETARAEQALGITFRVLGVLDDAQRMLERAEKTARSTDDAILIGSVERDLGEVWHDKALSADTTELSEEYFDTAEEHFNNSFVAFSDVDLAETYTTSGFLGATLIDRGFKEGLSRLQSADTVLIKCDNRVYELNNLVRLIRYSPPLKRWTYLPRALRLTSLNSNSSGDRKKVYAALAGNTFFQWAKRRKQGK